VKGDLSPRRLRNTNQTRATSVTNPNSEIVGQSSREIATPKQREERRGNTARVDGSVPEEEPFEKAVALDAGEEEGLRGEVGARVGEHGQLPLDLLHLLRRHGCFALLTAAAGPAESAGTLLVGIEPKGTRQRARWCRDFALSYLKQELLKYMNLT
jgi:hypothetical protein